MQFLHHDYTIILLEYGFFVHFLRFIEDALTPSSEVCQFDFALLHQARLNAQELPIDDPDDRYSHK